MKRRLFFVFFFTKFKCQFTNIFCTGVAIGSLKMAKTIVLGVIAEMLCAALPEIEAKKGGGVAKGRGDAPTPCCQAPCKNNVVVATVHIEE